MRRGAGFSLVEVVVASALLGGVFVAALTAVAAAKTGRVLDQQRAMGHRLAEDLMAEILVQPYREGETLGPDGESDFGNRAAFDDVDDYAAVEEATIRRKDGTAVDGAAGFRRVAKVEWVSLDNPALPQNYDTGVKRVTVTVFRGQRQVSELVALRTSARPATGSLFEQPQW